MLRQWSITKSALLWVLLLLAVSLPYSAAHAEVRAYGRFGIADHHMSRFHFSVGMTVCADLGSGVFMGVGFTKLVEGCDEETAMAFLLAKATSAYYVRWSIGYAVIDFRHPRPGSSTPVYLTIPALGGFVSAEIARKLTDRIAVQIRYQWNWADLATHECGYPHQRVSVGVEASL